MTQIHHHPARPNVNGAPHLDALRAAHDFVRLRPGIDYTPTLWHRSAGRDSEIQRCRRCGYGFITFFYYSPPSPFFSPAAETLLPSRPWGSLLTCCRLQLCAPQHAHVENDTCPECESPVAVEYDHWTDKISWTGKCSTCGVTLMMESETDGDSFSFWLCSFDVRGLGF